MDDLALLRRFEPVIHYTRGEHFFPMDVDRYIAECSLWESRPDQPPARLIAETQLTFEKLGEPRPAPHGTVHYLRFVEQLTPAEAARFIGKHLKTFHRSRGRLARVGLASRLFDAVFSITLILRGRVPGGTAAAAAAAYRRMQENGERQVYYGRVIRQGGYICLQYWFFYCMNDWRSSFYGVNDHESDWEQVIVYLNGEERPQWAAYASHDFTGDDLRRRWDDPELQLNGDHPIIFAGAGSHASYFAAGEYMHEVALPFSGPLTRFVRALQKFWRDTLRQGEAGGEEERAKRDRASGVLVVPFVDYARGDGMKIGMGGDRQWEARLLPDTYDMSREHPQAWVHHYRGLWGLYARDPIAGENAPAGPKYDRDGSVRRSWLDPLGWAGLDKVTPPDEARAAIAAQSVSITKRQETARAEIVSKTRDLRALGLEAEAMQNAPHFKAHYPEHVKEMAELSSGIERLHRQIATDHALVEALQLHDARLAQGERTPARNHIKMAHHPTPEETEQLGRLAEAWAALSIGVLMIGFILILLIAPQFWANGLVSLVAVLSFLEALFRREAKEMIKSAVVGLSLAALAVLAYEFALVIVFVGIMALGIFVMVDNLRELAG